MIVGQRIKARLSTLRMSQSELARRCRLNQSTIAALIAGRSRSSSYLHTIARALQTTPAYLTGEIDDADEGAPPAPAAPQVVHINLPVALPSENALTAMFEGLLRAIDRGQSLDEKARELAQLLPTGLSRIAGELLELPRPPRSRSGPVASLAAAPVRATAEPAYQR